MALSGTIVGNKNSHFGVEIDWSGSQNIAGNYTTVTANVYITYRTINISSRTVSCTIDGTKQTANVAAINKQSGSSTTRKLVGTFYKDIYHNSSGDASCTISASFPFKLKQTSTGNYIGTLTASGAVTLNTIPRASSITSASNVTLGNTCNVKWTPLASSFAYKLNFACGSVSYTTGYISPGTTSEYTYTGYTMSASTWAPAMSGSYSNTCTVTLYTYINSSSSNAVGSNSTTFTLTLSSSVKPSISNFTTTLVNGWNGCYIQGKSQCALSATFAAGTGSYISSCSISGTGISISGTGTSLSGTTSTLTGSGTFTYTAKVVDGRSTVTTTKSIYVYPYANPNISLTAQRTSSSGSIKITYALSCSSIDSRNTLTTLKIYSKASTSSTWPSSATTTISLNSTSANSSITLTGFSSTSSYDFKGVVTDTYGSSSTSATTSVTSEFRIVNINSNKNGLSIGKMSESNIFDCNLDAKFLQNVYSKDGAIISSDEKVKMNINNMTSIQEQLFNKLRPVTYEFKDGTSGRTHYGFISQDVENSLEELNLTGQDFAGFCKNVRVKNGQAVLDGNGEPIYDYSLRYIEFIALNTYMIQKLQAENNELKTEIQDLKDMIIANSNNME